MLRGFKLTLPNGDVFRAATNINSTHDQEWAFVFNGGQNLLALFEQFAQSDRGNDGLKQSAFIGTGAGRRVFRIEFDQYEGSTETWGGHAGADMQTLRDVFDQALATVSIDSRNTATLETGEFEPNGEFDAVEVVALSSSLTVNYNEETSKMNGTIELAEAADVTQTNSAEGRTG